MLVRLTDGWQEVAGAARRRRRWLAAPVRALLGADGRGRRLMQANIKFNGA
jgi:hypothetical protein